MKSCNEMTESVFKRINEYETAKRKKKRIALKTAAYAFCLCIAAGAFFTVRNIEKNKRAFTTEIVNSEPLKGSLSKTAENQSSDSHLNDSLGWVVINGEIFVQGVAENKTYTPDKYIGDARDFDGFYKDGDGSDSAISAEMYTVKESEDVIIIKLGNGGSVTLVKEQ